jgi:hypothetical protein
MEGQELGSAEEREKRVRRREDIFVWMMFGFGILVGTLLGFIVGFSHSG